MKLSRKTVYDKLVAKVDAIDSRSRKKPHVLVDLLKNRL